MFVNNWYEEKQSAWLYRVVSQCEPDPQKSALFLELAQAAESQAQIWEKQIQKGGGRPPGFHPRLRARIVARLVRSFGPRTLWPVLAAMKVRGLSVYRGAPNLSGGHPMPITVTDVGRRHKGMQSGGNARAAVFGVNDGLVSNAALIFGVAGAAQNANIMILAGVAGLLAGAFSMAAGEYVSVRSQRELFEYQIGLEQEELNEYPEEEQEELALIYKARGLTRAQADSVAAALMADKSQALETLAREELGLNPHELGSPAGAALSSFFSFAFGGLLPLLPFLFVSGSYLLPIVVGITAFALFCVGAILSLFTGRSALLSGLRMTLIGGGAGILTFFVGRLVSHGIQ